MSDDAKTFERMVTLHECDDYTIQYGFDAGVEEDEADMVIVEVHARGLTLFFEPDDFRHLGLAVARAVAAVEEIDAGRRGDVADKERGH